MQEERVFFGPLDPLDRDEPTDEQKRWMVDGRNPESPFSRFVGNERAVKKLQTAAYTALGRYNHKMKELAFSIFGPSSAGKTTLARLYAEAVELPFVEISPKSVKTQDDVIQQIANILEHEDLPLNEVALKNYVLPPMIIFLDEVHALPDGVVQGLLKATEFNDAQLITEKGVIVDTRNVTWIIATTDEGRLFDAFRTRFSPVILTYLTKKEVATVVKKANPDLDDKICELVAHYNSRVTRKALEFARYMRMVKEMHEHLSWEEVAERVATDEGIDKFGMQAVHLRVLTALGQGPIAKNRMTIVTGRKDEETERFIMPWLLTETSDQPAYVTVTQRGFTITEAGLAELDKRGISHNGSKAMAA